MKAKLSEVSDWMFAIEGKAYGAFTVNLLRSRMSPSERIDHDNAWQLDFGNPNSIRLVYFEEKKGFLSKLFGSNDEKEKEAMVEHPMSINMRESLLDELQESDELLTTTDDLGWTPLHREALAGNATSVSILIDHGADKNLTTHNGETPLDLAKKLNWDHVIEILL